MLFVVGFCFLEASILPMDDFKYLIKNDKGDKMFIKILLMLFLLLSCKNGEVISERNDAPKEEPKKEFPLLFVSPPKYYKISEDKKIEFEKSECYKANFDLRQNVYSILEGGGNIFDIKEYLDTKYFNYAEEEVVYYKGSDENLKIIQKKWDKSRIKRALSIAYIFYINLGTYDGICTVIFSESTIGMDSEIVARQPIQIHTTFEKGKIVISKISKQRPYNSIYKDLNNDR